MNDEHPLFTDAASWDEVQVALDAADLGDGLPLVPPTAARLAAMLAGNAAPDTTIGHVAPLFGELTPRAAAYSAVLAGCRPGALPVVLAAMTACLEPEFNLLGLMTTTGSAAVATLVHGPAVAALGLNPSINCLGPGNAANATIGRAISLCLRNIGGAREGSGDMATCGQPGKYSFCFAEGTEGPFEPLHVRRGLAAGASAVTVFGVSGTAEVLPLRDGDGAEAILDAIAIAMIAAVKVTGAARQPERPSQVFVLPPELGRLIAGKSWDLARVQRYLFEAGEAAGTPVAPSPSLIHPILTGGPGVKIAYLPLWGGGSVPVTRRI